jgi:hypothetical protein
LKSRSRLSIDNFDHALATLVLDRRMVAGFVQDNDRWYALVEKKQEAA